MAKRLLFTMVKNINFLESMYTKQFHFRHYDMTYFPMYANGKQIASGVFHLNMGHEKTFVMVYRTLF
jgi:hypothetical protein